MPEVGDDKIAAPFQRTSRLLRRLDSSLARGQLTREARLLRAHLAGADLDACVVAVISCYETPVRLLLGRDRELAALERALQRAALGRGDMTPLTGEPGIGKSQLADALADRAATRGTAVIRVNAWEQSSTIPYGVVYDCVRALARPEGAQVGGPGWIDRTDPLTPAEL